MSPPIDIIKLDHVAVATWDATNAVRLYHEVLGGRFVDGGDNPVTGFRWLQFEFPGGNKVEVLEPLHEKGFLYTFLSKRGEGMHHITYLVKDINVAIEAASSAGFAPVDVDISHAQWKEAFLHPRDSYGVLIQLAESHEDGVPQRTLEEFLADRPGLRPA